MSNAAPLVTGDVAEASCRSGSLDRKLFAMGLGLIALALLRLSPEVVETLRGLGQDLLLSLRTRRLPMRVGYGSSDELLTLARLAWPILLALSLWRWREPMLVRGAALTLTVMACETLASVIFGTGFGLVHGGQGLRFESRGRSGWLTLGIVLFGLLRLGLELVLMAKAWRIDFDAHRAARRQGLRRGHPRAVAGRLMVLGALGFAALVFSIQVWDGYIYLVSSDSSIRRLVLRSEPRPSRGSRYNESPQARRLRKAAAALDEASFALAEENFSQAVSAYSRAITLDEALLEDYPKSMNARSHLALVRNNLAWLLSTCAEDRFRDPNRAVQLARGAVALAQKDGNYWNTLGAAYFRAGQFPEADAAFARSMELRGGGDAYDWYFLAMIRHAAGQEPEANRLYERAVQREDSDQGGTEELHRFRVEAANALALSPPPAFNPSHQFRGVRHGRPLSGRSRALTSE
jgi:tetratricopeptide (TPR) repeat protein